MSHLLFLVVLDTERHSLKFAVFCDCTNIFCVYSAKTLSAWKNLLQTKGEREAS